jgi:heme/copper-type cytochrome/quinol oxidase subunit 4
MVTPEGKEPLTPMQKHEEEAWSVVGLIGSFLIGIIVMGAIWLFTGLVVGWIFS